MDIHNHWLHQEAQEENIKVEYTPSAEIITDSLSKVLQASAFNTFREQLGLKDLSLVIKAQEHKELNKEALDEIQEAIRDLSLEGSPA